MEVTPLGIVFRSMCEPVIQEIIETYKSQENSEIKDDILNKITGTINDFVLKYREYEHLLIVLYYLGAYIKFDLEKSYPGIYLLFLIAVYQNDVDGIAEANTNINDDIRICKEKESENSHGS